MSDFLQPHLNNFYTGFIMKTSFKFLVMSALFLSALSLNVSQAQTLSVFPNDFIGNWNGQYRASGSINIQKKQIIHGDVREPNYCTPVKITQTSPLEITVVCKMRTSPEGRFQKNLAKLFIKRIGNQLSYNPSGFSNNNYWSDPLSRD